MNAETKLALVLIVLLVAGLALICYGLGLTTKPAMVGTGIALAAAATSLLGSAWRGGR